MSKQFFVIGAGRFGTAVATTLYQLGHEVVVIDTDADAVNRIKSFTTHAMIADGTDCDILRQLGCSNFDAVIVAIGEDLENNILATVAAQEAGAKKVISKAQSEVAAKILDRVGADEVIQPEREMGVRLAQKLTTPEVLDMFYLGENYDIMEIAVNGHLSGTLQELRLPNRFGVQVIAVNRKNELITSPRADLLLEKGDMLVVVGDHNSTNKLRDFLSRD
jgi:trk system potassium uptake protein TrkA